MGRAEALGKIALEIGLNSGDLKQLAKAEKELTSSIDGFTKSATKVGLDKRSLQEMGRAGEKLRDAMRSGAKETVKIQKEIEGFKADHAKQMAKNLSDAARQEINARHAGMVAEAELRMEAVQEGIQKEKAALDDRLKTYQKGMEKVQEHLQSSMKEMAGEFGGELVGQLKGGGDLKSLASSMGTLLGKSAGKAGASMKGKAAGMDPGKMASALGGLGSAALALSAAVAPLALIAGLLFKVDEQQKEFNSTILDGSSAIDMQAGSVRELESNLGDLRKAASAVSLATRENTKDILTAMKAANEAGLQYAEMGNFVGGAGTQMQKYQKFATTAVVQARMLGVDISTVSEQMATWSEDLGGGLDSMADHFTMIQKAAMQSGFGTKRLFTAVSQATSGLALYNSRIDDTIALMGTLSKSLGKSGATEFVKALQKGFSDEGYQDRFKRLMIAGKGDMAKIMESEARSTTKAFSDKFASSDSFKKLQTKLGKMAESGQIDLEGVNLSALGDPNQVGDQIKAMAGMSEKSLRALLTQAERADPEMAQQLQTMIRLSKGTTGSISEQAKALDDLGPGGKLATQITGGLGGKAISEMSALELAAFESYAGVSGEALVELRRVDTSIRGEYERLKEIEKGLQAGDELTDDVRAEIADLHGTYNEATGQLEDANGKALTDVSQHIMGQAQQLADAVDIPMEEQAAISEGIQRNTISMQSVLENQVVSLLEQLTFINQGIWDATLGLDGMVKDTKDAIIEDRKATIQTLQEGIAGNEQELAAARKDVATSKKGSDERAAAEAKVAEIEAFLTRDRAQLLSVEKDLEGVRSTGDAGVSWGQTAKLYAATALEQGYASSEDAAYTGVGTLPGLVGMGVSALGTSLVGTSEDVALETVGLEPRQTQEEKEKALAEAYRQEGLELRDAMIGVSDDEMAEQKKSTREVTGAVDEMRKDEPDAIAEGMRIHDAEAAVEAAGISRGASAFDTAVEQLLGGGDQAAKMKAVLGKRMAKSGGEIDAVERAAAARAGIKLTSADDFIWRAGQGVTRINSKDTLLGGKPGGPLEQGAAGGSGSVNNVTLNINGGDPQELYRQLKQWGVI
jgi:hypothetical protein